MNALSIERLSSSSYLILTKYMEATSIQVGIDAETRSIFPQSIHSLHNFPIFNYSYWQWITRYIFILGHANKQELDLYIMQL